MDFSTLSFLACIKIDLYQFYQTWNSKTLEFLISSIICLNLGIDQKYLFNSLKTSKLEINYLDNKS